MGLGSSRYAQMISTYSRRESANMMRLYPDLQQPADTLVQGTWELLVIGLGFRV